MPSPELRHLVEVVHATYGVDQSSSLSPPPHALSASVLEALQLFEAVNHIGLQAEDHARLKEDHSRIHYLPVIETPDYSIGIFILPSGSRMPLHDHPSMSVASRILQGSVSITSYDWDGPDTPGIARLSWQKELVAPHTLTLDPLRGNVHELVAGEEGCTFVDVIVPPYDEDHGRSCTYYEARPTEGGALVEMVPVSPRQEFIVMQAEWPRGPLAAGE